jgi:hypothetical protein
LGESAIEVGRGPGHGVDAGLDTRIDGGRPEIGEIGGAQRLVEGGVRLGLLVADPRGEGPDIVRLRTLGRDAGCLEEENIRVAREHREFLHGDRRRLGGGTGGGTGSGRARGGARRRRAGGRLLLRRLRGLSRLGRLLRRGLCGRGGLGENRRRCEAQQRGGKSGTFHEGLLRTVGSPPPDQNERRGFVPV